MNNLSTIPTTGNEYDDHIRAKRRAKEIMESLGFKNVDYEIPFSWHDKTYTVDVYGEWWYGCAKVGLGIECQGKKGHSSHYAYKKDNIKKENLENKYKIKILALPLANFHQDIPDELLRDEFLQKVMR